jgi:hypothetical protein
MIGVVQWLRLALSKGPNWVVVFSPFTWGRKQIQFPKRRVFYSLEYRTMEKPKNPVILYEEIPALYSSQLTKNCLSDITIPDWRYAHFPRSVWSVCARVLPEWPSQEFPWQNGLLFRKRHHTNRSRKPIQWLKGSNYLQISIALI